MTAEKEAPGAACRVPQEGDTRTGIELPITVVEVDGGWRGTLPWTEFTAPMSAPDAKLEFMAAYMAWARDREDEAAKLTANLNAIRDAAPPSAREVRRDGAWVPLADEGGQGQSTEEN